MDEPPGAIVSLRKNCESKGNFSDSEVALKKIHFDDISFMYWAGLKWILEDIWPLNLLFHLKNQRTFIWWQFWLLEGHLLSPGEFCWCFFSACENFEGWLLSHCKLNVEIPFGGLENKMEYFFTLICYISIELMINKTHGLSPPGGLVSPSGGFASLLFDQVRHFASIKLCLVLSHQGAIIKIPVVRCHCLWCLGAQLNL